MQSRTHSPAEKSHVPINTTLVARQQTAQPVNAPKLDFPDPKFNFDLSKIPLSSPHRPSQPPPRINPKLGSKNFLNEEERETKQKNSETAIQTFAPSTPVQPKLTISTPGDQYEQEADTVAAQVVERINTPNFATQAKARLVGQSNRQSLPRYPRQPALKVATIRPKVMLKPLVSAHWIERVNASIVQRDKLRTRAGGQELIAHESTHVVQQSGSIVQRSPQPPMQLQPALNIEKQIVQKNDSDSDYDPTSDQEYDDAQDAIDEYDSHEWSPNIPKNKDQTRIVNSTSYIFHNDSTGCIDFETPKPGGATLNIEEDVNIADGDKVKHTSKQQPLKQKKGYNYWHFRAANMESGRGTKGISPPGLTWHHHKDTGRMQLIDRDVHAAFLHKGGKSIWGT